MIEPDTQHLTIPHEERLRAKGLTVSIEPNR